MDRQLLEMLVCPKCKRPVSEMDGGKSLVCDGCKMRYPVHDGIPIMSVEEAMDMQARNHSAGEGVDELPRASFRVVDGPDANMTFQIESGTCRALGRATADPNKTSVFNVDIVLELDETTKRLVLQYVSSQFRKSRGIPDSSGDRIGSFKRVPDIVFTDGSLSRLHAMIFYDTMGIGILDLVSKNGTFVNGKEIESKLLTKGDVIEMGETTISFEG